MRKSWVELDVVDIRNVNDIEQGLVGDRRQPSKVHGGCRPGDFHATPADCGVRLGAASALLGPARLFAQAAIFSAWVLTRRPLSPRCALRRQILKGAKPGDCPSNSQPNSTGHQLKTAKALGIRISQAMLVRADEVIEYHGIDGRASAWPNNGHWRVTWSCGVREFVAMSERLISAALFTPRRCCPLSGDDGPRSGVRSRVVSWLRRLKSRCLEPVVRVDARTADVRVTPAAAYSVEKLG